MQRSATDKLAELIWRWLWYVVGIQSPSWAARMRSERIDGSEIELRLDQYATDAVYPSRPPPALRRLGWTESSLTEPERPS